MESNTEPERIPARLDIYGGKSATFEPGSTGKIVVENSQSQTSNLTVYKVRNEEDKSVNMAFCFELKRKKYVLGVEGEKIYFKTQAQNELKDFSNKFLFRWARNQGQYGSLNSVAEPTRYLRVCDQEVTLSTDPDDKFKVNFLKTSYTSSGPSSSTRRVHTCHQRLQCGVCSYSMGPPNKERKCSRKRKACS